MKDSENIDWSMENTFTSVKFVFSIPKSHPRSSFISEYRLVVKNIDTYQFLENDLILCDKNIKNYLKEELQNISNIFFLIPDEKNLKDISKANILLSHYEKSHYRRVIAIGGGVITNFGGYIAEKLGIDLVYIPTTVIAMSDASIGGKVRLNSIKDIHFNKHSYKTFYEPSEIILDPQFLNYLSDEQIRVGLAEIIKHAIYQSFKLATYLLSSNFNPFQDRKSLLRAVLWTIDLKRVCLEIDSEELKNGSYKILRAAHDISDKLEEQSHFTLSHGEAVEKAMIKDLHSNTKKHSLLVRIYQKLGITLI